MFPLERGTLPKFLFGICTHNQQPWNGEGEQHQCRVPLAGICSALKSGCRRWAWTITALTQITKHKNEPERSWQLWAPFPAAYGDISKPSPSSLSLDWWSTSGIHCPCILESVFALCIAESQVVNTLMLWGMQGKGPLLVMSSHLVLKCLWNVIQCWSRIFQKNNKFLKTVDLKKKIQDWFYNRRVKLNLLTFSQKLIQPLCSNYLIDLLIKQYKLKTYNSVNIHKDKCQHNVFCLNKSSKF